MRKIIEKFEKILIEEINYYIYINNICKERKLTELELLELYRKTLLYNRTRKDLAYDLYKLIYENGLSTKNDYIVNIPLNKSIYDDFLVSWNGHKDKLFKILHIVFDKNMNNYYLRLDARNVLEIYHSFLEVDYLSIDNYQYLFNNIYVYIFKDCDEYTFKPFYLFLDLSTRDYITIDEIDIEEFKSKNIILPSSEDFDYQAVAKNFWREIENENNRTIEMCINNMIKKIEWINLINSFYHKEKILLNKINISKTDCN